MKKLFLSLSLALVFGFASAKTITVDNKSTIANYQNLQTAIDAAFVGDTILVHASSTSYGNATLTKRVHLIGEGYLFSADAKAKPTIIGVCYIDSTAGGDAVSGLSVQGFDINYISGASTTLNKKVNEVLIKNCRFSNLFYIGGQNWFVVNCVLNGGISEGVAGLNENAAIHNCVIASYLTSLNNSIINNCVITGYISSSTYSNFNNCIFTYSSSAISSSTNLSFNKCSFVFAQTFDAVAGISQNECLLAQDPRFVNTTDYQLKPDGATVGSINPLIGAGSDGKDIGLSGGSFPVYVLDGRVNFPQVRSVVVKNGVVAPGEAVKVQITGGTRKFNQ
jgi:hypothetical protein